MYTKHCLCTSRRPARCPPDLLSQLDHLPESKHNIYQPEYCCARHTFVHISYETLDKQDMGHNKQRGVTTMECIYIQMLVVLLPEYSRSTARSSRRVHRQSGRHHRDSRLSRRPHMHDLLGFAAASTDGSPTS